MAKQFLHDFDLVARVVGPYETLDDVPVSQLCMVMQARLDDIKANPDKFRDYFGSVASEEVP